MINTTTQLPTKHAKGLYVLFLTEMWERFAYYLMIGILLLYLIDYKMGGMGWSPKIAADVVGTFIATVYISPFLGGIIADRYFGYIKSVYIGGLLMSIGYGGLAFFHQPYLFYTSLLFIVIGNGFFKPNISTLLGNIYNRPELKPIKDNAYNIFYMGINTGALFCNFVAAFLRNRYGWGAAFGAASIGLLLSLIIFSIFIKHVKEGDVKSKMEAGDIPMKNIVFSVFIPAIIAAIVGWFLPEILLKHSIFGSHSNDAFLFATVFIVTHYIRIWKKAVGQEKKSIGTLLFIFFISIIFWTIYNQNATGLTVWAEEYTDRTVSPQNQKWLNETGILQTISDTPIVVKKSRSIHGRYPGPTRKRNRYTCTSSLF